ncbi:HAMP domain-containing sensor histidine kinase [Xanthocytophaga agilis]|uniref:histidine kinase n=1 Tax=Xanthocytophaga agilis TaxID=3048010 RepID=A0AAE3RCV4_9BACT|nr:HAMP domain-containing sensor histidine kinase [Xanthocytophaga agilis]MDJ1506109.1 HAMP domain-containing sensor histidine kinase [Xanthocytophaga agilis]
MIEDITKLKYYLDVETKYSNKKNAILHILSHELAGPLGTIQSLSSLTISRLKEYNDEDLIRVVSLISQTSKHSLKLIRDFVEQEFLESSEVDVVKGRVDLVQKTRELIEQFQHTPQQKLLTFQFTSSDPSIYVAIDEVKFILAITNLVSNSIKFTPEGGLIAVHIEDQPESDSVLVRVEDNGIGIPEKYHSSLFDKFTKARRPGLHNEPTTGLGMSIIKTIVEWHQGKIWFESQEGKGTTFFVQIPRYIESKP